MKSAIPHLLFIAMTSTAFLQLDAKMTHTYKTVDGQSLRFEIDLPEGKGPFPVILYAHSWSGNLGQLRAFSQGLVHEGIAGVRINYRKMSEGTSFAEARKDIETAIAYLREHAQELNLDMTRLGMVGASAGAVLTSRIAQDTPECIAYAAFNGGFDLVNPKGTFPSSSNIKTMFPNDNLEALKEASAIHNLRQAPPATLLLHGSKDSIIDYEQAVLYGEAVRSQGGEAIVVLYPGEGHGFFNETQTCFPEVYRQFEFYFKYAFGLSQ